MPNKKGLTLVVSKGRTRPRVASASAITREVTRLRLERLHQFEAALRAAIGNTAPPRPKPLPIPTVFADVDVAHGELPVVSWPTYKRRVRAYLERIARRR